MAIVIYTDETQIRYLRAQRDKHQSAVNAIEAELELIDSLTKAEAELERMQQQKA